MASTIFEQILENVQRGTVLPQHREEPVAAPPGVAEPPALELDQLEARLLRCLDREFDELIQRARRNPAFRELDLADGNIRRSVLTLLEKVASEEIPGELSLAASPVRASEPTA